MGYTYAISNSSLIRFLKQIPDTGLPDKVSTKYLMSLGYRSSNDRAILRVLRTIGLISTDGVPTEQYRAYRDKTQSSLVLAAILRSSYKELFQTYPAAQRENQDNLENFFSTHTGQGKIVAKRMVSTFLALAELSNFSEEDNASQKQVKEEKKETYSEDLSSPLNEPSSAYHTISMITEDHKQARLIIPITVTEKDIERLKKHLDILII